MNYMKFKYILFITLLLLLVYFNYSQAGLQCDFESNCTWDFDPSSKNGGFRVISGKEKGGKSGAYNLNAFASNGTGYWFQTMLI